MGGAGLPVEGEIDLLCDSRIRLRICAPDNPLATSRVIRDPSHCVIRAFDKFLNHGSLKTGKIWVIFADNPNTNELRILMALAITNITKGTGILENRRLILFPRCMLNKPTAWKVGNKGEHFAFNLHHISVEAPKNGKLTYHLTGANRDHRGMSGLTEKHEFGTVVGHLVVGRFEVLDEPGILIRNSSWLCNSSSLLESSRLAIRSALEGFHPIITVNPIDSWVNGACLNATFAISDVKLSPKTMRGPDIVIDTQAFLGKIPNEKFQVNNRIIQFNLGEGLFLNVCTAIIKAIPIADVTWIT